MNPHTAKFPLLCLMGLSFFCLSLCPQVSFAQQSALSVGFALGLSSQPEEKDFQSTSQTVDLNVNLSSFRFGYNSASSYLNMNLYDRNWPIKLKSETYYGAWVFGGGDKGSYLYGLAGLGYQVNRLSLKNGLNDQKAQNFGLLTGVGYLFDLNSLFLGMQWMMISGQSKFADLKVATGSSQFQISGLIPF